jgi:hypothetical protein
MLYLFICLIIFFLFCFLRLSSKQRGVQLDEKKKKKKNSKIIAKSPALTEEDALVHNLPA